MNPLKSTIGECFHVTARCACFHLQTGVTARRAIVTSLRSQTPTTDMVTPSMVDIRLDSACFPDRTAATLAKVTQSYLPHVCGSRVYDITKPTPLHEAPNLSQKFNNHVFLKREDLHPIFSFKIRGAYNKIASLTESQTAKGIACASAGNHAQGVAYSARHLGISAKIFMPTITQQIKVDAVRRFGGEVILCGNSYNEAQEAATTCCEEESRSMIHPFDDPFTIAGQGTVGLEFADHKIKLDDVDIIFMGCGGGGLLAGVGAFVKAVAPHVQIIGVEAEGAAAMTASLLHNTSIVLDRVDAFADGAASKTVGAHTFAVCKEVVDEMIVVTNDEICGAIKLGHMDSRVILEPAGALGIAGLVKHIRTKEYSGKRLVAIASGANMDFDRLRHVTQRAATSE